MHRVAHEHVGVQGATAFFAGFAQPVMVGKESSSPKKQASWLWPRWTLCSGTPAR